MKSAFVDGERPHDELETSIIMFPWWVFMFYILPKSISINIPIVASREWWSLPRHMKFSNVAARLSKSAAYFHCVAELASRCPPTNGGELGHMATEVPESDWIQIDTCRSGGFSCMVAGHIYKNDTGEGF